MADIEEIIAQLPFPLGEHVVNRQGVRPGDPVPYVRINEKLNENADIICCVCSARLYDEEAHIRTDGIINNALFNALQQQPTRSDDNRYLACNVCSKLAVNKFPQPFMPYRDLQQFIDQGLAVGVVKVITTYQRTHSVIRNVPGFLKFKGDVKLVFNDQLVLAIRALRNNQFVFNVEDQYVALAQCLLEKQHFAQSLNSPVGRALLDGEPLTICDVAKDNLLTLWAYPQYFNDISQLPDVTSESTILQWLRLRLFGPCFPYRDDSVFQYYLFTEMELQRAYRHFHYRAKNPDEHNRPLRNQDVLMNVGQRLSYNQLTTCPVPSSFRLSASFKVSKYLDLLAVAKDFGEPTLFLTFSSNMFGWPSLTEFIRRVKGRNSPPNNEAILYARYFKRRFQIFYNEYILKVFARKVGGIDWSYQVVETGKNGFLHVHLIMKTGDSIQRMIDKNIIRSSAHGASRVVFDKLHKYQIHKCGDYCLVDGKCRFDIPRQRQQETELIGDHVKYKMRCAFDIRLVNCIDEMRLCWDGQMNAQYVPSGKIGQYVTKYCSKSDSSVENPAFVVANNVDTQL
ncbi:hypothetical protein MP228_007086 [Amoeboaphelidium protococcarum]|nr:hypothetical protein MP228_007086 [Amoeboaphelidium protococcarum]